MTNQQRPANRLAREKSPYLRQHQYNPVDWFAWGEEAFTRARSEQKPIFLSVGYSTCHWCHVMERESFESEQVAAVLNRHFVSIKVDREERPDVDRIYMTFVQSTSGGGGWPLNVFLTPDLKPFFGGTYFPPESRVGRPGLVDVLREIARFWETRRAEVEDSAQRVQESLSALTQRESAVGPAITLETLHAAAAAFKSEYDPHDGGFGPAPKFPRPSVPLFLLRYGVRFGDEAAIRMVLHTCERMAAGGIHDHLGGGFARYSVDARWLVPHFEKMLYDNAQLLDLYLDAYRVSGNPRFAEVARGIVTYVRRDLTHADGGFFSAEDADSEGKEGKFYCWTRAELKALLSAEEFEVAEGTFGITDSGNFVDHSDPEPLPGQNVLSLAVSDPAPANLAVLESARAKMLAARSRRVRPRLDDKVLASWNGLMLGALAHAHAVLGDEDYRIMAEKALAFLREKLWDEQTRTLHHRWREGERDAVQLLDAYAFVLAGALELYEATLDPETLGFAVGLAESMIARFHDQDHGGFWQSGVGASDLILRVKEDYDGAEPSGNSVAILALLRLGAITGREDFGAVARRSLRRFAERLDRLPQALPHMLMAVDQSLDEGSRVVVAGSPDAAETRNLLRVAHSVYGPSRTILGTAGPVDAFVKTLPKAKSPAAYVCSGFACQPPTGDPAELRTLLQRR